jgi:glycosyl transferase family 87
MGRAVRIALGGSALVLLAAVEIAGIVGNHGIGSDFAGTVYHPARAVVHGSTPYGDPRISGPLAGSVYPPSAFVPFAWLGFLGHDAAVAIWLVLMTAAAAATLRVLGVRDVRCYAVWLLTPMMLSTIAIGNATTLVVLLVAVAWRFRDRAWIVGLTLAAAIATKLFAAPLVVWLVATRRYRAAAIAAAGAPALILAAWASIGFSDIGRYPSILSANDRIWSPDGPYLQGLLEQLHSPSKVALGAGVVVAAMLLWGVWVAGDVGGYTLAACAAIVLSPVAWIGYTGLLIVPLAAAWPRWSRPWLLLLGTYVSWYYFPIAYRSPGLSVCTLGLVAAIVTSVLRKDVRRIAPPRRLGRWTPTRSSSASSAA